MNSHSKIYYTKPSITQLEISYVMDAAQYGWGDKCYEYINRFECLFKQYLNVKYAIATSSCTGAMHMGLKALGIGPGDEVILADTNWIATAAPIVHLGAKPVFVDIMKTTWCLDPDQVELAITKRTKAIIAVHLYGNLCEMDRLLAIGKQYGIPIVEDAAEAIGSIFHGFRAGSLGTFGVFSFHGTKTVTTGEGGMFVTNDQDLYELVLTLSNHGRKKGEQKQFWSERVGFKYKMSNVQAAIGCAQMERVDELVSRKQEILKNYKKYFSDEDRVYLNPEYEGIVNGSWMPNIVFDPILKISRDRVKAAFTDANIDGRVFFYPLSSLPCFGNRPQNFWALDISQRSINLPSYHDMSDQDQERVVELVKNIIKLYDK